MGEATSLRQETMRILTERFGYGNRRASDIINIPDNWRVTASMKSDGEAAKAQALANLERKP